MTWQNFLTVDSRSLQVPNYINVRWHKVIESNEPNGLNVMLEGAFGNLWSFTSEDKASIDSHLSTCAKRKFSDLERY